jgi:hypothetical protein
MGDATSAAAPRSAQGLDLHTVTPLGGGPPWSVIFPNKASIIRLIGAVHLEQNDEWLLQHRDMQI